MIDPRKYNVNGPTPATPDAGADPGNTDPDELTAPLDPDDDVYALLLQDQGDLRETAPVGEDPQ